MATFLVFDVADSQGRVSPWRMRITDQDAPADAVTLATAIATAGFGAAKPSLGGISNARVEIDGIVGGTAYVSACDIRLNWQASIIDADGDDFRNGIPARNPVGTLLATGTKDVANLSESHWVALATAMFGGTAKVIEPKDGEVATGFHKVIASDRPRKRVREGGSR